MTEYPCDAAGSDRMRCRARTAARRFAVSEDGYAHIAFVLSLMVFAFGYGVATMKYQIFPHSVLSAAQNAADALRKVERTKRPPHFIRFEPDTEIGHIEFATADQTPEPDVILMTGGFYYRNDICPEHGCLAWIMERSGKVLHSWSYDPEQLFTEADFEDFSGFPGPNNVVVQGVDLDPQGNLVVTFQGRNVFPYHVGIAKFAPDGTLLWKRMDNSHHWPTTGPDGRIYAPSAHIERPGSKILGMPQKPRCKLGAVYEEGVRVISPEGETLHEFWMSDVLADSDMRALAYAVRDDCDPHHVNGIDLLNANAAARLRAAGVANAVEGDMAVSLRSSSTVVIMDAETGQLKHVIFGPMVAQHSPATMPDGSLLIFDNLGGSAVSGGDDGSRILRLGLDGPAEVVFPRPGTEDHDFFSPEQGAVNVNPDGTRMLIAETLSGRVLEVDIETGRLLWLYEEVGSIAPYLEAFGSTDEGVRALQQTQGAAFVPRATVAALFGKG